MAIVGVLFIVNLLLARVPEPRYRTFERTGTTYSNAPDGCELLYRLLDNIGFNAARHRYPLAEGYVPEEADVIWHTRSSNPRVGEDGVEWIDQWVASGGMLVLIDDPGMRNSVSTESYNEELEDLLMADWFDRLGLEPVTREVRSLGGPEAEGMEFHRMQVGNVGTWELGQIEEIYTYRRRGLIHPVVFRFSRARGEDKPVTPRITDSYGIVIASTKYGRGSVWIVSDPYVFGNLFLQETGNSLLAISMILRSRDGEFGTVLFDEYHLGFVQTRSLADAASTPVGRTILYLGLIAALTLGMAGARFGPIRKPPGAIGVSQRAFVRALAVLWMNANATAAAADALWRRFSTRRDVRRQGLDVKLDGMRRRRPRVEELIDAARNISSRSQSGK